MHTLHESSSVWINGERAVLIRAGQLRGHTVRRFVTTPRTPRGSTFGTIKAVKIRVYTIRELADGRTPCPASSTGRRGPRVRHVYPSNCRVPSRGCRKGFASNGTGLDPPPLLPIFGRTSETLSRVNTRDRAPSLVFSIRSSVSAYVSGSQFFSLPARTPQPFTASLFLSQFGVGALRPVSSITCAFNDE